MVLVTFQPPSTTSTRVANSNAGISQKCACHIPCVEIICTVVQPPSPVMPVLNDLSRNCNRLLEDRAELIKDRGSLFEDGAGPLPGNIFPF